jgi:sterol desaturase/sphingolipid hydroxylase (fatty acid hydroxylase superfamily)
MAGWEVWSPRRPRSIGRAKRWPHNLGIAALNALIVRIVFPVAAVGAAFAAESRGWGLLNTASLPGWAEVTIAIAVLDLALYAQHFMFHKIPVLWRLHRMHHADLDPDVTTGARFHPFEIVLSMILKIAVVSALGAPALAVVIFEVLLNAFSMFNHANVTVPPGVEKVLRLLIVTPDMHRVHHSIFRNEIDSNFGFQSAWWDRLFRTYRAEPRLSHETMTLGLEDFRDPRDLRLDRLLVQPFVRTAQAKRGDGAVKNSRPLKLRKDEPPRRRLGTLNR